MRPFTSLVLLGLLASCTSEAAESGVAPGNDSILARDLRADLFFLAGDGMRGRLTNTPENALAAEYIKSRFEHMGLEPAAAEGSYFQNYDLMTMTLGDGANSLEVSGIEEEPTELQPGEDYYPLSFSATGSARGGVVYAGFGITARERGHNDYSRGDIEGKIVLVLEREPGVNDPTSPFDGVVTAEASRTWRKALFAQQRGAVGILFVRDVHNRADGTDYARAHQQQWLSPPRRIPRYTLASWMDQVQIPAAQISATLAEQLVAGTGRTLEELARAAETSGGIEPVPLPGPVVELSVAVDRHRIPDRNVVAKIEGSDPDVSNEVVIICAHYDHDGATDAEIRNGADDDGSGTVALLEIAEAYAMAAESGNWPRRTVLFAAWNTEERGLLGAWAYTENPLWPLTDTVAVLNMDMVGRNEEVPEGQGGGGRFRGLEVQTAESNANAINVLGYTYSSDMVSEVERANERHGLELRFRYDDNVSQLLRRSDHWPFLQQGVPAVWMHTGLHPDYHRAGDRPERINYQKMESIARMVHQASWNLAQQDSRPMLDRDLENRDRD